MIGSVRFAACIRSVPGKTRSRYSTTYGMSSSPLRTRSGCRPGCRRNCRLSADDAKTLAAFRLPQGYASLSLNVINKILPLPAARIPLRRGGILCQPRKGASGGGVCRPGQAPRSGAKGFPPRWMIWATEKNTEGGTYSRLSAALLGRRGEAAGAPLPSFDD